MTASFTPILVGCGEVTDLTTPVEAARSPVDLIAQACRLALADADSAALARSIDVLATLRLFSDSSPRFFTKLGRSTNPPASIARRLGVEPRRYLYSSSGGNMPQSLVNGLCELIAAGEVRAALVCGGEALRTQQALERAGAAPCWDEDPGGEPEFVGDARRAWSDEEDRHLLRAPIAMYPLIENAIRRERGSTLDDHLQSMARLFAAFSQVAAGNPLAARREVYSAQQLATVDAQNRWIGFPYPKLMNSHAYIDQSAAVILTSVEEARRLGIAESKWVYLHGCADGIDQWFVSQRVALHTSPAIRLGARQALAMAGKQLADMTFLDLYSCFPSAVEIGCREIGLQEDDPRGLTVTGGLPYFGGPGNNYVTHSIATMMRRLRSRPGTFGLVTANGNYVTKHAFGVYSTAPIAGPWRREDPSVLQRELDQLPQLTLVEHPRGPARIETYTILHGKSGPELGIVFGRLTATGERFIANTPSDPAALADLQAHEGLSRPGMVRSHDGRNLFEPQ